LVTLLPIYLKYLILPLIANRKKVVKIITLNTKAAIPMKTPYLAR
jgi:hypothetical protein